MLAGVTALFLGFSGAYIYSRVQNGIAAIQLPPLFFVNTIILAASSYTLILAKRFYLSDQTEKYKVALLSTLILTLLFLVLQIIAWKSLINQNILINSSTTTSYLYVISFVHFAHVIGGLPFLILFAITAYRKMKEPVSVLIYFSDPTKKRKLKLLTTYWHYLDGLWIYLVLFFLINSWI
ncbi:MAG: cytochrome c oxidase subunit 3 [Bacteroidota bacterium]